MEQVVAGDLYSAGGSWRWRFSHVYCKGCSRGSNARRQDMLDLGGRGVDGVGVGCRRLHNSSRVSYGDVHVKGNVVEVQIESKTFEEEHFPVSQATGMDALQVFPVSQAVANQHAGRAGTQISNELSDMRSCSDSADDVKSWWIWGYWSSPLMYAMNGESDSTQPIQPRHLDVFSLIETMDTSLFSPSSLFADSDGNSIDEEIADSSHQNIVERRHQFPGMEFLVRELYFHELNANLLFPRMFAFAEWLVEHRSWLEGRRTLELGSGTGALAIFPHKSFKIDITTSDYDDKAIKENVAHNCQSNGISTTLPHIKHAWGEAFLIHDPHSGFIIASYILLYVKHHPNLIKTLSFLLRAHTLKVIHSDSRDLCLLPLPAFLIS